MKILHTADWHLGKYIEGASRLEEQAAFLDDFVALVKKENVDMVIIAGDVYDQPNPPSKAESLFYETLKAISENGKRLTVVIAGNHDNPDRLVAAGPLAKEHGILMFGLPKTKVDIGAYGKHQVLMSEESVVEIHMNGEKVVVAAVAYPSEKRLNEVLYDSQEDEVNRAESYGERLKAYFDKVAAYYREDSINLLVSHLFAMSTELTGSERGIQLGGSYMISPECFPDKAQYIALGHVHKPQLVPGTKGRARYSGSPIHYSKKEINFEKKCLLIELTPGSEAIVTDLVLPVYKPIEIWRTNSVEEAILLAASNSQRSCWVYLEIETDRFIREDEIKAIRGSKKDILEITPIMTGETKLEDRDSLDVENQNFDELFDLFYEKERGVKPTPALKQLLNEIMHEEV